MEADRMEADADSELPESCLCPISQVAMSDPVLLAETGHTYERSTLLEWFDRGGRRDPLTNQQLAQWPPVLIPNHTTRKIIAECQERLAAGKLPAAACSPAGGTAAASSSPKAGEGPPHAPAVVHHDLPSTTSTESGPAAPQPAPPASQHGAHSHPNPAPTVRVAAVVEPTGCPPGSGSPAAPACTAAPASTAPPASTAAAEPASFGIVFASWLASSSSRSSTSSAQQPQPALQAPAQAPAPAPPAAVPPAAPTACCTAAAPGVACTPPLPAAPAGAQPATQRAPATLAAGSDPAPAQLTASPAPPAAAPAKSKRKARNAKPAAPEAPTRPSSPAPAGPHPKPAAPPPAAAAAGPPRAAKANKQTRPATSAPPTAATEQPARQQDPARRAAAAAAAAPAAPGQAAPVTLDQRVKQLQSKDAAACRAAAEVLEGLVCKAGGGPAAAAGVVLAGGVPALVALLACGDARTVEHAVQTLRALVPASQDAAEAVARQLGSTGGALLALLKLLGGSGKAQHAATATLKALVGCDSPQDGRRSSVGAAALVAEAIVRSAGGMGLLLRAAGSSVAPARQAAAATLAAMAGSPARSVVEAVCGEAVPVLVKQLCSSSEQAQRCACEVLLQVTRPGGAACGALAASRAAVVPLVRLLDSGRADVQQGAAEVLLRMLQCCPALAASVADTGGIGRLVRLLQQPVHGGEVHGVALAALTAMGAHAHAQDDVHSAIVRAGGVPQLVQLLASRDGAVVAGAMRLLRQVALGGSKHLHVLVQGGVMPALLGVLGSCSCCGACDDAVAVLRQVTGHKREYADACADLIGLARMVRLLDGGSPTLRGLVLHLLMGLTGAREGHNLFVASEGGSARCASLAGTDGMLQALLKVLQCWEDAGQQGTALAVLRALLMAGVTSQQALLEAGCAPALVQLVGGLLDRGSSSGSAGSSTKLSEASVLLAGLVALRDAEVQAAVAAGMPLYVRMLRHEDAVVQHGSLGVLMTWLSCSSGIDPVAELVQAGVVPALSDLVRSYPASTSHPAHPVRDMACVLLNQLGKQPPGCAAPSLPPGSGLRWGPGSMLRLLLTLLALVVGLGVLARALG